MKEKKVSYNREAFPLDRIWHFSTCCIFLCVSILKFIGFFVSCLFARRPCWKNRKTCTSAALLFWTNRGSWRPHIASMISKWNFTFYCYFSFHFLGSTSFAVDTPGWYPSMLVVRNRWLASLFFLLGKVRKWRNKNSPVRNTARTAERERERWLARQLLESCRRIAKSSCPRVILFVAILRMREPSLSSFQPVIGWKLTFAIFFYFAKRRLSRRRPVHTFPVDSFPRLKRIFPVGGRQIQRVMPVSLLFFLVNSIKLLNVVYDGQFGQQQH